MLSPSIVSARNRIDDATQDLIAITPTDNPVEWARRNAVLHAVCATHAISFYEEAARLDVELTEARAEIVTLKAGG